MANESLRDEVASHLPGYASDIADKMGIATATVCRHLRKLEADNLAYIDVYTNNRVERHRGVHWTAGPRPADAPKPPDKKIRVPKPLPQNAYLLYRRTDEEDKTIERAKESPASWWSTLDAA